MHDVDYPSIVKWTYGHTLLHHFVAWGPPDAIPYVAIAGGEVLTQLQIYSLEQQRFATLKGIVIGHLAR